MDKKTIKKYLSEAFLSEESVPGIDVTKKANTESGKINKAGIKDIDAELKKYDKDLKKDAAKTDVVKKFNYTDDAEKTYHDEMEIMNGQEMIQYDRVPSKTFQERAEEAISGSARMGNEGGLPNAQATWGASSDTFGKDLIKKVKDSIKRRDKADKAYLTLGDDIELLPEKDKGKGRNYALESVNKKSIKENEVLGNGYTHFAINKADGKIYDGWQYDSDLDASDIKYYSTDDLRNNFPDKKPSDFKLLTRKALERTGVNVSDTNNWYKPASVNINENNTNKNDENKKTMKRLRFKQELKGAKNALRLIPESYKVDNTEFEMTDGNETYRVRWEGTLTEGEGVIVTSQNQSLINEDIDKMKKLFNYNSQDTLGIVRGNARIDENSVFTSMLAKTKQLLSESKDDLPQAKEAKKDIKGSVPTDKKTEAPAPKTGDVDDAVKVAPEAKKHIEGSVDGKIGMGLGEKSPEGEWDQISVPQAAAHGNPSKTTYAPAPSTGEWDKISVPQAADAKKHVHMNENEEEEVPENKEDYKEQPGYIHEEEEEIVEENEEEVVEGDENEEVIEENNKLMFSKSTGKHYIVNESKTIICPNNLVESAKKDVNAVFKQLMK